MSATTELLAEGQAPINASPSAIYTAPALTHVYECRLWVFNTNTTEETFRMYLTKSGGTRRQVLELALGPSGSDTITGMELGPGDSIDWSTTTASKVNGVLSGRRKT